MTPIEAWLRSESGFWRLADQAAKIGEAKNRYKQNERADRCLDAAREIERLGAETKQRLQLLIVAKCPNDSCNNGVIPHGPDPDGNWQCEQCQWCYERKKELEDGNS